MASLVRSAAMNAWPVDIAAGLRGKRLVVLSHQFSVLLSTLMGALVDVPHVSVTRVTVEHVGHNLLAGRVWVGRKGITGHVGQNLLENQLAVA